MCWSTATGCRAGAHKATAIVGGDAQCRSIAAASIIAKVTRDRMMLALDAECPGYGWAANKGYGTPAHQRGARAAGGRRRTIGAVLRRCGKRLFGTLSLFGNTPWLGGREGQGLNP